MEFDQGQQLSDIEAAFEKGKAERYIAKTKFEAAKGLFHMKLVARREAGENLTVSDMKAMEAAAIDTDDLVKQSYLHFIEMDSQYRGLKVTWEDAKRKYWDNKSQ